MKSVIVVAPHPDDETLGCGGTLLKHQAAGDKLHWLITTRMTEPAYSKEKITRRQKEIEQVASMYPFASVHQLDFPTTELDTVPQGRLVEAIGRVFREIEPHVVYVPNHTDAHSDHRVTFSAAYSCTKWFRYPSVHRVLMYEAVSETEFCFPSGEAAFCPNSFTDISDFLEKKIAIMKIYESELANHPFPRSAENCRALATVRGATSGFHAAESFVLLKELLA